MLEKFMKDNIYRNYVGGDWIDSRDNQYIDIVSPIDNSIIGRVSAMSKDDIDKAIESASEAQKSWKYTTIAARRDIMLKAADILERQQDLFVDLLIREVSKDKKSAISEVIRTVDLIKYTANAASNILGEYISGDSFPGYNKNKKALVDREPLGVILAISPFNYPINLAASKIVPAIMAGNTVVFKPATQGAISGINLVKVFEEAGLPAGVLNSITGKGSEIGDYSVTHPSINMINFTGSTEIGVRISEITKMTPLLMELGGKDAAIVLEDADLEVAANQIVSGAFSYSGQRCTAIKRILVDDKVADELVQKLKYRIEELRCGNPLKEQVDIVPLIDDKSADYIEELIEDSKTKGALLVTGGKRTGKLIYPTLFDKVTLDMRLAWEEPFGPILPIIRINSIDEAIDISNASKYGLQGSIFTNDIDKAFYIADRLEVGTVQINNKTERGPDNFPFLGIKASGVGTQGIRESMISMTRSKVTVLNLR